MKIGKCASILLLMAACLPWSFGRASAQAPPAAPANASTEVLLTVTSADGKSIRLTAADLEKLPHRTVQAADRGQEATSYEGTPLAEVLRLAGAPLGEALKHGDHPTAYVLVEAKDGYRALFALSELDPAFSDAVILLADRKDGKPLAASEGPLRIIVPGEKRHARWVRQVTGLRLGKL